MKRLLLIAVLTCLAGAAHAKGERFHNPTAQFALTKPEGWVYLSADQNSANLKMIESGDAELRDAVAKYATVPMVVLAKHPEPFPDLNPTFKVNLRLLGPWAGQTPTAVLDEILPTLRKVAADVTVVQPPTLVKVDGLDAGYLRLNYKLRAGGAEFPTTSEMWLVPRGEVFFLIGAGSRQDETTGTRAEIAEILQSIRFGP